jgi:nitroreductase
MSTPIIPTNANADANQIPLKYPMGRLKMENLDALVAGRRSVRTFLPDPISPDDKNRLLEAVRWAPSWANTQCWEVVWVSDPDQKKALQEAIGAKNPATRAIVAAPAVVALCGKTHSAGYYKGEATTRFGDWMLFDIGLATQNFCLTAHNLGLGTVIVGLFDHDRADRVLELPIAYKSVVLIPVGRPAKVPKPPKRREQFEFTHQDSF